MSGDYSGPPHRATGDEPRWHRYTPQVWQSAAYDDTSMLASISNLNVEEISKTTLFSDVFDDVVACLSSAIQLIRYALAWQHPALGVDRWIQRGKPTDDRYLKVIDHLLGENIEILRTWLWHGHLAQAVSGDYRPDQRVLTRSTPLANGGYDSFHLIIHSNGPLNRRGFQTENSLLTWAHEDSRSEVRRAILEVHEYAGWYTELTDRVLRHPGQDVHVDVYCKPVGWMGTFRCSPRSRKWHCTSDDIHSWGLPNESR